MSMERQVNARVVSLVKDWKQQSPRLSDGHRCAKEVFVTKTSTDSHLRTTCRTENWITTIKERKKTQCIAQSMVVPVFSLTRRKLEVTFWIDFYDNKC